MVNMQNITPHITIAISTYNVEKYIRDSLLCIINQSLKNIEIICIDDASTDNTLKIIQKFAVNDHRIKVISKIKNEGLSVSRNKALELAKGKYITFVDGDDLMDLNLFKKAFNLAEKNKSDLVIWDHLTFWNSANIKNLKAE
ncbi:MAG TPA: glycosyltransferase family 2 protein, partial [Bacteroidia bacterium]|nr:glycosyltransferase family 2 protein [Bacteroidia bacterium]